MSVWLRRGLFSLNSFVAAMLALYIALSLGLTNPFWSMTTVYIVSQPQAGSVRSKALYRLLGTMVGAAAAVAFVPSFANAPELLSLILALWVGFCLSIALLDRTPRSYVFMLSGYTAALIGFPSVINPAGIFDVAIARVEEIGLGITCATIVHSIFKPQSFAAALNARINGFMGDVREWVLEALAGQQAPKSKLAHKLAVDVTELHILSTHLPFDTSDFHTKSRETGKLSEAMALLLSVASAVSDRLGVLRLQPGSLSRESEQLLADVTAWVAAGVDAPVDAADPLIERARALETTIGPHPDMMEIMSASLHARIAELIGIYRDCRVLGRHIVMGAPIPDNARTMVAAATSQTLHRDYGMAAWSGVSAMLAILAVCAFWILTGWPEGATAAMMTAIFASLFAALDDPAKAITSFGYYTAVSVVVAAIYLFVILPPLDSFPMLVLVLAPFLLVGGVLIAMPAWMPMALPVIMGAAGALAIQETFAPDFMHFANTSIAMLTGTIAASVVTRLVRSVGADFSARRIIRLSWRDIARNTRTSRLPSRTMWNSRMVDRVGLLGPRLAASGETLNLVSDVLGELRIGFNILDLRQLQGVAMPDVRQSIAALMADLEKHFLDRSRGRAGMAQDQLLSRLDGVIHQVGMTAASPMRHSGLLALAGLRRSLFPESVTLEKAAV